MKKVYLGIDMGSVSTKGVIIDEKDNIITSTYFYNKEDPIENLKRLIKELKENIGIDKYKVVGIGTTGNKRKLIGMVLKAGTIKNEIVSHAKATLSIYPDTKTIIEMGGEDFKIINIDKKKIINYEMSNLYTLGIKSLLSKDSNNYDKLNNILKHKKIEPRIVFQGGAAKNNEVVKVIKEIIGPITIDNNAHLMGALGVAILSKENKEKEFSLDLDSLFSEIKTT